ncbi:MAG TPA: TetR family transcriptional regulator [Mycobacteriales bacterium]|nr:TetR family transcriptional regulator [Mycobacteriales bacterium]
MLTAADIRAEARLRVRGAMLDAAHELAVERGWGGVRMGAIAARVGVSRQTLHAEFGTKEALGEALVLRVTDRFLLGVAEALEQHGDRLGEAVRAAVTYTLRGTSSDPLLQTVLTSTRGAGDETLLPLLTSRGEPLLHRASDVLGAWVRQKRPELDPDVVADVVDSVVRLVVSHAVLLLDPPDVVADRLARLAERALGERPA